MSPLSGSVAFRCPFTTPKESLPAVSVMVAVAPDLLTGVVKVGVSASHPGFEKTGALLAGLPVTGLAGGRVLVSGTGPKVVPFLVVTPWA